MTTLNSPPNLDFSPKREPLKTDWRTGYVPVNEKHLRHVGLRGKNLCAVVSCLVVLWIMALLTLTCNIFLLIYLRIGPRGMEAVQFVSRYNMATGMSEPLVQFRGRNIHLGTIVSNHGVIGGYRNQSLTLESSRVIVGSKRRNGEGETRVVVEEGRIRLEGADNLLVSTPDTDRPLFSAAQPRFRFRNGNIKRIAAQQILTNKVRSPIDKRLRFQDLDNLSFRGNEGNFFTSKTLQIRARNNLGLRTSRSGSIRLKAEKGVFLGDRERFPVSSSPSLSASELGHRLCLCSVSDRVFVVPGNKPCSLDMSYCF